MRQTIFDHVTFGLFTAALPDILGSVEIGMRFPSARATPKLRLIPSVALLTVATLRARPAGVARIDQLHQDSCQCRLMSDHLAELREPPRVQNPSLAVPNFCPCADSFPVLHTDSSPGAFSRANDRLANTVVRMASETRFLARQLLQSPFGGTGLLGLHRDGLGSQIPTQDARIVRKSAIGSEPPLSALIERVGIHHLGDPPHGHLSGQTKALADLVVDQFVECQLSEGLVMPRLLANPIAGAIGSLEGTAQSVRVGRRELDCDGESRNRSIEQDQLKDREFRS
jgi:hypothetical protein